jgi:ribonuclease HI
MLSLYTDGSSTGRADKPGGYGWIVVRDNKPLLFGCGGSPSTTNNIMELVAVVEGLEAIKRHGFVQPGERLEVVSDSEYVLGLASGKYHPKRNRDLAIRLRGLFEEMSVEGRWVKGHRGDPWNERADRIAKKGKEYNSYALVEPA